MAERANALRLADQPESENAPLHNEHLVAAPDVCNFCFGTGMEVVVGKGARRYRAKDRRAKLMEAALIPHRYSECSLQSYKPVKGNGSHLIAFNHAFRLVREYPAVDRGLLLMGTCGVGKTHLSVAIPRGLAEKGIPCLFYEFGMLLKELLPSMFIATMPSSVLSAIWKLLKHREARTFFLIKRSSC
jgi:DNA replication protein DnaC